ncbi:hypothetical protein OSB04_016183 [Centaurea solstitialis]|uniref:F-box domain-containing protein n=1 Tax=Centaurea solstitialis TaxID=347529 RepID=A0AA38T870_9ASTR|nr:hypothetical protein OSB04_016183 [Centaurea solstitialis]
MENLLAELTIDILSRLPVKTIFHCKRVCKKWRNLVLGSFFVNLGLSRSPTTSLIVHQVNQNLMDPGTLKWVEIEDKVDHHHLHYDSLMSLNLNRVPIFQISRISLKGSVNGLTCLRHYSTEHDDTYICNPVTREILILPPPQCNKHCITIIVYGFGVSSLTREYKAVRTLNRKIPLLNGDKSKYQPEAEVYTLGTGQWRSLALPTLTTVNVDGRECYTIRTLINPPSMEDLPVELMIDILSRLPVRTIIHCKLVCKKWRNLVSDSSFVNLHLFRSSHATGLIIHQNVIYLRDSGFLKWVEIEDKADHHHLHHEKIIDLNTIPVFQNSHISQMGSVNGLICLWQSSPGHDNTYICNPITREILILPTPPQYHDHCSIEFAYGFGVSSLTGVYKVVRTLNRKIPLNGNKFKMVSEAEVYTLGTGQWRTLGGVPRWLYESDVGAVLNDRCHWILYDYEDATERICTFDLNTETFQLFPSPPFDATEEVVDHVQSLAVLKGCLCISNGNHAQFTIWVMKEYGIKKSWHKETVVTKEAFNPSRQQPYWYTIYLVEGLKDGTIFLMTGELWAFYPTSDTIEEIDTCYGLASVLAYRPSFLKLQNFESERVHML